MDVDEQAGDDEDAEGAAGALGAASDADLLGRLRAGEVAAYEQLWCRYIGRALRTAARYAPDDPEDLASEAFLLVYRQVTESGKGPSEAFWPYLNAVMRNLAVKWGRERGIVAPAGDLEVVDERDALALLADEDGARELLDAFEALPERWQRVLWLTDVEDLSRPAIAGELGIKPNAVSALARRARAGLQQQWLATQIPVALRTDPAHVGAALPQFVVRPKRLPIAERRTIDEHLAQCEACRATAGELRAMSARMRNVALGALGFAALGGALPASGTGAATAAAATIGVAGIAGIAGGVVAASIVAGLVLAPPGLDGTSPVGAIAASVQAFREQGADEAQAVPATVAPTPSASGAATTTEDATTGRNVVDPSIPEVGWNTIPDDFRVVPDSPYPVVARPVATQTPGVTSSASPSVSPSASASPSASPSASATPATDPLLGDVVASAASPYEAPTITGTAAPEAEVYVTIDDTTYATSATEAGAWLFDTRTLALSAEAHAYTIQALADDTLSAEVSGVFEVLPVEASGFEDNPELPIDEARTTGIVTVLQGPAGGEICIASPFTEQSTEVALNDAGTARVRVLLFDNGFYLLEFQVCSDDFATPVTERFASAVDPDVTMSFFGGGDAPGPGAVVFEVLED